jgi:hypothetical protein
MKEPRVKNCVALEDGKLMPLPSEHYSLPHPAWHADLLLAPQPVSCHVPAPWPSPA